MGNIIVSLYFVTFFCLQFQTCQGLVKGVRDMSLPISSSKVAQICISFASVINTHNDSAFVYLQSLSCKKYQLCFIHLFLHCDKVSHLGMHHKHGFFILQVTLLQNTLILLLSVCFNTIQVKQLMFQGCQDLENQNFDYMVNIHRQ